MWRHPIYLVTVGFVHARRKNMETELSLWKCAKPSFSDHTTRRKSTLKRHNHRSFWICVWGKRGQGNEWHCYWTNCNLIVFVKLRLNNFPSTLKRKPGAFQFLWLGERFRFVLVWTERAAFSNSLVLCEWSLRFEITFVLCPWWQALLSVLAWSWHSIIFSHSYLPTWQTCLLSLTYWSFIVFL